MRQLGTAAATLALIGSVLPADSARAADAYPAKLMVCAANPNDGAFHSYSVKVLPTGPGSGLIAQVRTGIDGKKGCLTEAMSFKGGSYTVEFFNLERYKDNGQSVTNSRITKLVVKNKGKKAVVVSPPKKQGESVTTTVTVPPQETTKLTYTATVLKPAFKR